MVGRRRALGSPRRRHRRGGLIGQGTGHVGHRREQCCCSKDGLDRRHRAQLAVSVCHQTKRASEGALPEIDRPRWRVGRMEEAPPRIYRRRGTSPMAAILRRINPAAERHGRDEQQPGWRSPTTGRARPVQAPASRMISEKMAPRTAICTVRGLGSTTASRHRPPTTSAISPQNKYQRCGTSIGGHSRPEAHCGSDATSAIPPNSTVSPRAN